MTFLIALANICFVTLPLADPVCGGRCSSGSRNVLLAPTLSEVHPWKCIGSSMHWTHCRGKFDSPTCPGYLVSLQMCFPPEVAVGTTRTWSIHSQGAEQSWFTFPWLFQLSHRTTLLCWSHVQGLGCAGHPIPAWLPWRNMANLCCWLLSQGVPSCEHVPVVRAVKSDCS